KRNFKEGRQKPHDTASKYLLSGIARCGACNFPMNMNPYTRGTNSHERYGYRYACISNLGGCGGVTRVGPPVEELVIDLLFEKVREQIGSAQKEDAESHEAAGAGRLEEIQRELNEINDRWKAKRVSSARALDMIEELEAERAALGKKRRQQLARSARRNAEQPDLPTEWKNSTPGQKRQRLRQEIRAVIVHPVGRGKSFDPEAIEIIWQE
ncbi:zinc ribbon domain-containing protein, partial [Streptomyces sp. AA1529]|uniref:zinc ribbon domain-containing protein n=1 Tax=Streptomyces sp. AA1529 TaxID=1203257 RepID=UPI00178C5079